MTKKTVKEYAGATELPKFKLPPKGTYVTVKFIPRRKGMAANVSDDHVIAGYMLDTAVKTFVAPLQRNNTIKSVLTNEEKEVLEKMTGRNLSVYGEDSFWKTFTVKLRKAEAANKFDLGDPFDYMSVKVLEAQTDAVAKSWAERNNKTTYQFAITRLGEVKNEKKVKLDKKKEAFKLYARIEEDKDKLLSILKIATKKNLSADSNLSWIQAEVEEYLDKYPNEFIQTLKDPKFETRALFAKALQHGIIKKQGNVYLTIDGLELSHEGAPATYDNAINYLWDDRNTEVYSIIQARLENV